MTTIDIELAALLLVHGARLEGFLYPLAPDGEIGVCLGVERVVALAELLALHELGRADLDDPSVRFELCVLREHLREEREWADYVRAERAWIEERLRKGLLP